MTPDQRKVFNFWRQSSKQVAAKMTKMIQLKPRVIAQVKTYKQGLSDAKIAVDQLIVFGSQAKANARKDSDIDVAVISPQFGKDYHRERVKLMGVVPEKAPDIEPHPLHPKDLNDRWSTFAQEIKRHGIRV
ncbi:MAG: nucleotidyltransferase domain-containing protein [Patescibacteria group bacterium]